MEFNKLKTKFLLLNLYFFSIFSFGFSESLDYRLYNQIHERWKSPVMDEIMKSASNLGEPEVGLSMCLIFSTFGKEKERETAKIGLTSLFGSSILTTGLKGAINRKRPDGETERWNSSFPSGHTSGSFALATIISRKYPSLCIPSFILATIVGVSRVYLGRHFPSDVLGGAVVGIGSSLLVLKYEKKILSVHLP